MRRLLTSVCACLAGLLACPLSAREKAQPAPDLTVILDFGGPHSQVSVHEMEGEAARILKAPGLRLGWAMLSQAVAATYKDLVVVRFRGSCEFDPARPPDDGLGPYAITHVTDGRVLPFGEVDCDRVVGSVMAAMAPGDYARANTLVGRAMGRVVVHELVHMLTKSIGHGTEGVERATLSGRQLIEPILSLGEFDIDRLKQEHSTH